MIAIEEHGTWSKLLSGYIVVVWYGVVSPVCYGHDLHINCYFNKVSPPLLEAYLGHFLPYADFEWSILNWWLYQSYFRL